VKLFFEAYQYYLENQSRFWEAMGRHLALPYLGTGFRPALFALTVLALPPVLINTYAGIRNVDRAVVVAASGMGMQPAQVLRQIELPIAQPAIIAGIRTVKGEYEKQFQLTWLNASPFNDTQRPGDDQSNRRQVMMRIFGGQFRGIVRGC
jgi:ABC-type spermidine/putrescine transport system permease subunit II